MSSSGRVINLGNFLSNHAHKIHASGYHHVDLEIDHVKQSEFDQYIGEALRNAYADPDRVSTILRREGFDEAAKYISGKFPTKDNPFHVRNGDYGEVVTQVFFQDLLSMDIPIIKLRYKTNWQKAAFGIDVIAFRLDVSDPQNDRVIFAEVKASKSKTYGVKKVFEELEELVTVGKTEANQKMRNAIHFICDRLAEQNKRELEERLYRFTDSFTNPQFVENFAPVLIRDKDTWEEDALDSITLTQEL